MERASVSLEAGARRKVNVLQDLDENAAEAEGDELAEAGVGDGADDDLLATHEHLLDLDADDAWRRLCSSWRWRGWCRSRWRTSSSVLRPTRTPPASVLWRMSGLTILSTTVPMGAASLAASSAEVATPSCGTAIP